MNNRIVLVVVLIPMLLIGALTLGLAIGQSDYGQMGLILGPALALGIVVVLGARIWILIPCSSIYLGTLYFIPGGFSPWNILSGIAFVSIILRLFTNVNEVQKPGIGKTDLFLLALLAILAITAFRGGVGLRVLGSGQIGSRPYFEIFVGTCCMLVMRLVGPTDRDLKHLHWYFLGSVMFLAVLQALSFHSKSTGELLWQFYSGFGVDQSQYMSSPDQGFSRPVYLRGIGLTLLTLTIAIQMKQRKRTGHFFVSAMMICLALLAILLSGFRSVLVIAVIYVFVGLALSRQREAVFLAAFGGVLFMVFAWSYHHSVSKLPASVQRALTFLPGDWDTVVKRDAAHSIEWRLEMWERALKDPTVIRSKLIGDGFGYSANDMALMQHYLVAGVATIDDQIEYFTITGSFHSGPISTIKHVGYIGCLIYLCMLILMMVRALRLIRNARGTEFGTAVLFWMLPVVVKPFYFLVVFGDFRSEVPQVLMHLALLVMFERRLRAQTKEVNPAEIVMPESSLGLRTV